MEKEENKCTNMAMREKKWDELGLEEKIDRLRITVRDQDNSLIKMSKCLNQLLDHRHLTDGVVAKRLLHLNAEYYDEFHYHSRHLE